MSDKPTYEELDKGIEQPERSESERKRAEATSADNCRTLAQIIQGIAIPAFVIDHEHVVTHWNFACEKLTGISSAEMTGI